VVKFLLVLILLALCWPFALIASGVWAAIALVRIVLWIAPAVVRL
jgi:hypothetical protein